MIQQMRFDDIGLCAVAMVLVVACRRAERGDTPPRATSSAPAASSLGAPAATAPATSTGLAPRLGSPCSPEMAPVGDVCVDRWEAHLVVMDGALGIGGGTPHPPFERPVAGVLYAARSTLDVFPQGYISKLEAIEACGNARKRLCTATEWYTACSGRAGTTYPYGNRSLADACSIGKPHLLSRWFGDHARGWTYEEFNNPFLNQDPDGLSPTGTHPLCISDYGVADQVGNLHEWVSDFADPGLQVKVKDLEDSVRKNLNSRRGNSIFMGGFYSTSWQQGKGCSVATIGHEASYHDYSTGFRCCADALSLLPVEARDP